MENNINYIEVDVTNIDSENGILIVEDDKMWREIKLGEKYFAVASWKSVSESSNLFSQKKVLKKQKTKDLLEKF